VSTPLEAKGALRAGTGLALGAAGAAAATCSLYLAGLAGAALARRRPAQRPAVRPAPERLVVVVPAHDEAGQIADCVASLRRDPYPDGRVEVVVVADNCSDDTAAAAEAAGARVLVRDDPSLRGKGHALRFAFDRLLAEQPPPDAVAVVDADAEADPGFLIALTAPYRRGAEAVQGESLLRGDGSAATELRAAAFLLVNRTRPAGRAALGLPCDLTGTGMLFAREVLAANPWDAYTSAEDLEYSIRLRLAGTDTAYARDAVVRSPAAPNARAAEAQRLRWEGGKLHVARARIPELVRRGLAERRPELLEAALALAVPPLGLLAGAAALGCGTAGVLVAAGLADGAVLAVWATALGAIPVFVLVGLRAADAPPAAYRALATAPVFVARKLRRLPGLVRFSADTWVRTERAGEAGRDGG
jgi:Glycosyltransferase like family 2